MIKKSKLWSLVSLWKKFMNIKFIAEKGLPIRSHDDEDVILKSLLKLRCNNVLELKSWVNRDEYKWLHHDSIEEIMKIMANSVINVLI